MPPSFDVADWMVMTFNLPFPVWTALLAAASMLVWLMLFSRGPLKIESPARRLQAVYAASALLWVILLVGRVSAGSFAALLDLLAGAIVLFIAAWFMLNAWMFLVWGFRFNLLISLYRIDKPALREEWIADYTDGKGLNAFLHDRLSLALKLRAVRPDGNQYVLTAFGYFCAWILKTSRAWFGYQDHL